MIKFADIGYECDDVKITRQVPPEEHTRQVPPEDLFPLLIFINFYHFSDSLTFIFNWFLCLLMLIIFCLFWTSILNIQWSWSFYVYIYFIFLSCDSSRMCKNYWLCLCTLLHSCCRFRNPPEYELFLLPKVVFPFSNWR